MKNSLDRDLLSIMYGPKDYNMLDYFKNYLGAKIGIQASFRSTSCLADFRHAKQRCLHGSADSPA